MNVEREREAIAKLRETIRYVEPGEFWSHVQARVGIALTDQIRAASDDAEVLIAEHWSRLPVFRYHSRQDAETLGAELMAGVERCLAGHHCRHAALGDRPIVTVLAARVASCRDCMRRFRGPLLASKKAVQDGRDRLCDYCLTEPPGGGYRDTAINFGPYEVLGSMCNTCFEKTREGAEVAA